MSARSFRSLSFPRISAILLVTLAYTPLPTKADGAACLQSCNGKDCRQVSCGEAVSTEGFCQCQSAALPWSGETYSSWCRVSGPAKNPSARCAAADTSDRQLAADSEALSKGRAMAQVLEGRNPYVASLIDALEQSGGWVVGPVQGLLHDSYYDEQTGQLSHGEVVPFSGAITTGGLDSAQVQITVGGDLRQLARLRQYVDSAVRTAVPPVSVRGVVTDHGLHGSLLVVGLGGNSETIQW